MQEGQPYGLPQQPPHNNTPSSAPLGNHLLETATKNERRQEDGAEVTLVAHVTGVSFLYTVPRQHNPQRSDSVACLANASILTKLCSTILYHRTPLCG